MPPPLKRDVVAARVRAMIADGRLKPGAAAPTGLALAALTGFSPKTCNTALEMLVQDGVLSRGSRGDTRPRVAPETGAGANFAADPRAASRALSARLRERRHARKLTQPELADLLGTSRSSIGHAETGRLWHARDFWQRADAELGGDLLQLFDAYLVAESSPPAPAGVPPVPVPVAVSPVLAVSVAVSPECVTVTWSDGTVHVVRPPGC